MNNTDENQKLSNEVDCKKEKNQFFSALNKIVETHELGHANA